MHPYRNLLIMGVNKLLDDNLLSLDGTGKDETSGEEGHVFCELAGQPSLIAWETIDFEEVRCSVWWMYDHSKHPQANYEGSYRENFQTNQPLAKRYLYSTFVGATVTGWLERKDERCLQGYGRNGLVDLYNRRDAQALMASLPKAEPHGFVVEGKLR